MIALKPATSIAVCCLVIGSNAAFGQNEMRSASPSSAATPLPAPQFRPYVTSMPQGRQQRPSQNTLPPPFRTEFPPPAPSYSQVAPFAARDSAPVLPGATLNDQPASSPEPSSEKQPAPPAASLVSPSTPAAMPPGLPDRPRLEYAIPTVPPTNNAGLNPEQTPIASKAPLSWRAKAYRMQNGNEACATRELSCSSDDAIMVLLSALPSKNLKVDVLNSRAGELLAAPAASTPSKQRYVFTICETNPGNVVIKAAPLINSKDGKDLLQNLLRTLTVEIPHRGAL